MVNYERIEELSRKRGISFSRLSSLMGLNRFYLYNCRNRALEIPEHRLKRMAELLDTNTEYLCGESDWEGATELGDLEAYFKMCQTRPECVALLNALRDASPEDVTRAVRIIEALKGVQ